MLEKHENRLYIRNYGWVSKVIKRKCTYFISINKPVIIGGCLHVGDRVYSYFGEDSENRPVMVTYLDCKPRNESELEMIGQSGFVERDRD